MLWMLIGFLVSIFLLLAAAGAMLRHVLKERTKGQRAERVREEESDLQSKI